MKYCIGDSRLRKRSLCAALCVSLGAMPGACASFENAQRTGDEGARPVQALPGWHDETAAGLRIALSAQCQIAKLQKPWPRLCHALPSAAPGERGGDHDPRLKTWVANHFKAWPVINGKGARGGLLTGYFEPLLTGSRERESANQVALHQPPAGHDRHAPYKTREQIELGLAATELAGRELVWLDDRVAAFFLHIQGSGRIRLRDGSIMRAGFAAHNGQPYHAIGRDLIDRKQIARADISAQSIARWLRANPQAGRQLMRTNPRYIFFRELPLPDDAAGPPGSLRVPLTGLRSVATDKRFVPAGSLLYLDSRLPLPKPIDKPLLQSLGNPLRVGLALSQDTGGAITGQVRADLFTGTGAGAGELAGRMRQPLQMWLLWPKGSTPPARVPVQRRTVNY